jgi:o-succinylbenzoate synthase
VKLRGARLIPYALPLARELQTAHGRLRERRGWLLELEADSGALGRGDACPYPGPPPGAAGPAGFGMEPWPLCGERLQTLVASLMGRPLDDYVALVDGCRAAAPDAPAALFALDCALHELAARAASQSVAQLLAQARGRQARSAVPVSALVSASGAEEVAAEADALRAEGFQTFKLKVGGRPLDEDLRRARALRAALGSEASIRLDANGAFSREQAAALLEALADLGVELIEQPVAAGDIEGLKQLRASARIPIAADESMADPGFAERVLAADAADFVVLKPAALGGLRAALALADRAAAAGVGFFVTGMLDSVFGVGAALHLAAALPADTPAHGLATSSLFEFDLAPPPPVEAGQLRVPEGPGWGIEPDADAIARASRGDAVVIAA